MPKKKGPNWDGLPIRESDLLVGAKNAIRGNDAVWVSPAMATLIADAFGRNDLERTLKLIPVADASSLDPATYAMLSEVQ